MIGPNAGSNQALDRAQEAGPAQFAIEQMLRGLDRQAVVLSELRQRASIVLSATGIIASLLGAEALNGRYSHTLAVIALTTTAAGMTACIGVLWRVRDQGKLPVEGASPGRPLEGGTRQWKVTLSGQELVRLVAQARPPADLLGELAIARRVNHRTLEQRSRRLLIGCWLLLVQLVAWSVTFLDRTW